jgi:hypothetical protein
MEHTMAIVRVLAICLASLSVTCQLAAAGKCSELETAKAEVQLAYLQRDRASLEADCVFYAIVHVGVNPSPEGIKTLITYLDYQYPDPKSPYGFVRMSMYPFPAVVELAGMGTLVVPAVLEAIANPATPLLARNGAIHVIFLMNAQDMPEAVRVLKRASKAKESTDWNASQQLFDAARKAAEWCKGKMASACMDAFYNEEK